MNEFKQILFPVDFSKRSDAVAPFILSLARRGAARVTLLHVLPPAMPFFDGVMPPYPSDYDEVDTAQIVHQELIEFGAKHLPKVDVTATVRIGDAAGVITAHAVEIGADLIAMPTHGYGVFKQMVLGSVTAAVLRQSPCAVWTDSHAPEPSHRAHPAPRFILCAIDLQPASGAVIDTAIGIANATGAAVEVLHVAPESEPASVIRARRLHQMVAHAELEQCIAECEPDTEPEERFLAGVSVSHVIREVALEKRADLVVIGRGTIRGVFGALRSDTLEIVRESPCPVLSV